jgi:hypothetical protein
MKRLLAGILALLAAANGLVMLLAGRWWYGAVPGVAETGPFNPHFVKDIGAAFLTVGLGFGWLAARGSAEGRGAALTGAAFLAFHGLIHIAGAFVNPDGLADLERDFAGVALPALVALWIAWPKKIEGESNA